MSLMGLLALLGNMSNQVKNGDLGTLNWETLAVFLFQQIVSFIVNMNYTSQVNPSVWVAACMSSIVAGNVILFLIYLKSNGFGTCEKVRSCTESEGNLVKLPGPKELQILGGTVAVQLITFYVVFVKMR